MSVDATQPPRAPTGQVDANLPAFLAHLKRQCTSAPGAPAAPLAGSALRESVAGADVVERFVAAAQAAGCEVQRVTCAQVCVAAADLLRRLEIRTAVLEPRSGTALRADSIDEWQTALAAHGVQVTTSRSDATLFDVGAAITGVELAIAETGTLVCTSGEDRARGTSLLPPVHVAVLHADQIVPDLFDVFDRLAAGEPPMADLPANVTLITGPSKTADIEGVLVTGVHGPGAVHILLIS